MGYWALAYSKTQYKRKWRLKQTCRELISLRSYIHCVYVVCGYLEMQ